MAKKKPAKRTTAKKVQDSEAKPFKLPPIGIKSEVDDDDAAGDDGLTEKQRRFVFFYMGAARGNATKAAQLAGYRDDNNHSLRSTAYENLTKPDIQRAIERERGRRFGSPEDVRCGIAAIANGNAADFLKRDDKGKLHLDLEAMAEAGSLGLLQQLNEKRIEVSESLATTELKFKLYDKLKALELLARMNGQLKETVDHNVTFNPITLDGDKTAADDDESANHSSSAASTAL